MELIHDKALLRLNMHILSIGYQEKGAFRFTKVTGNNEETNEDGKKAKTVSDSKEELKKKGFT